MGSATSFILMHADIGLYRLCLSLLTVAQAGSDLRSPWQNPHGRRMSWRQIHHLSALQRIRVRGQVVMGCRGRFTQQVRYATRFSSFLENRSHQQPPHMRKAYLLSSPCITALRSARNVCKSGSRLCDYLNHKRIGLVCSAHRRLSRQNTTRCSNDMVCLWVPLSLGKRGTVYWPQ